MHQGSGPVVTPDLVQFCRDVVRARRFLGLVPAGIFDQGSALGADIDRTVLAIHADPERLLDRKRTDESPSLLIDHDDAVIALVGDQQMALAVYRESAGFLELR